tara:strand:+ start:1822 stop:2250 length:429 start_codon:yes stop_codon:yes gene_type:complete
MSEKKKQLKKIASELKKASKMHASQAKRVEKISNSPLYMKSGMGKVANGSPINLNWGTLKKIKNFAGLTPKGAVGLALFDTGVEAAKWMHRSFDKAENINMNDPKYSKYAEWYYGKKKNPDAGKTKKIKKGDQIEATGTFLD